GQHVTMIPCHSPEQVIDVLEVPLVVEPTEMFGRALEQPQTKPVRRVPFGPLDPEIERALGVSERSGDLIDRDIRTDVIIVQHVVFHGIASKTVSAVPVAKPEVPACGDDPLLEIYHFLSKIAIEAIKASDLQRATIGVAFASREVVLAAIADVVFRFLI